MVIRKNLFAWLFFWAAICHSGLSLAATTASDLKQQAEQFLAQLISPEKTGSPEKIQASHYEIGPIDARLQLADCTQPLQVALFNPPTPLAGRITLQIQCDAPSPWKIYIKATLHVVKNVVVTLRPLPRGHTLTPADIQLQARPLASLRQNYFEQLAAVTDKKLKQAVAAGSVLTATALENARCIVKNQQVTISSGVNAGVNVKTNGIALRDGNLGDRISVRNSASNKVIEATVMAPGLVSVNP